jgi:hypothetical protein
MIQELEATRRVRVRRRLSNARSGLPGSTLRRNLDEVKACLKRLEQISGLDSAKPSLAYVSGQKKTDPHALQRSSTLMEWANDYYNHFFDTLTSSFRCSCPLPHEVNLRAAISRSFEILFRVDDIDHQDRRESIRSFVTDEAYDILEQPSMSRIGSEETIYPSPW